MLQRSAVRTYHEHFAHHLAKVPSGPINCMRKVADRQLKGAHLLFREFRCLNHNTRGLIIHMSHVRELCTESESTVTSDIESEGETTDLDSVTALCKLIVPQTETSRQVETRRIRSFAKRAGNAADLVTARLIRKLQKFPF